MVMLILVRGVANLLIDLSIDLLLGIVDEGLGQKVGLFSSQDCCQIAVAAIAV